ncbi:DUF6415 family natural product biosynthesis protein [Streptomyces canus]|uniref:DUF6415 family natural product biosynthesis protein n=1 Tax=Streptomyces canus TaxID=58343 RepID=UPI002E25C1A0
MTVTEEHQIRPGVVRRDYLDGLNATEAARAEELCAPLTDHVRALVREVRALMPDMHPQRREQAAHCLKRAAETLDASPRPGEAIPHTFDLAVSARSLLGLYRRPCPYSEG